MKMAWTFINGPLVGQWVEFIGPGSFLIGRARDADFRLPEEDLFASRRHATLEITSGKCRIRDMGTTGHRSTNLPKVNGRAIDQVAELSDGDLLELGSSQFKLTLETKGWAPGHPAGDLFQPLPGLQASARLRTIYPHRQGRTWAEGTTVLAVEDDPLTTRLIRATLEPEGLTVLEATNGREGLAVLKQQRVDMVTTDLMMPNMDGFWLIREIRELQPEALGKVPILVLSQNGGEEDMLRCLAIGADDYLTKPFSPQVLITKLWRFQQKIRV